MMTLVIAAAVLGIVVPVGAATPVMSTTQKFFPTGQRSGSVLLLERITPQEVRMGMDFDYQIKITNLTNSRIEDVILTEQSPVDFNLKAISPQPESTQGNVARWSLGTLGPRGTQLIQARGSTNSNVDLNWCATVTFKTLACASTRIVEPKLELALAVDPEVMQCDPIPLRLMVRNTGSGTAKNVVLVNTLPAGWRTTDGRSELRFDAGDLAAGQSRTFNVDARALSTGQFTNTARATEAGGLTVEATAQTTIVKPQLAVTASGPDMRFIGRPATVELTVTNQGDAPANNTVLVDQITGGVQLLKADQGGQFSGNQSTWRLGTIQAGGSRTVSVTLSPRQKGPVLHQARATAHCAEAQASTSMQVEGVPAILLEVIDIEDPIEVGANVTYEIRVLNQGSAEGTNIAVTCTLPPEQEYVSGTGPTMGTLQGKTLQFAPLPRLDPKATAIYRVVVKGSGTGDVRFKVSIISDQIIRPVAETESTHIY